MFIDIGNEGIPGIKKQSSIPGFFFIFVEI